MLCRVFVFSVVLSGVLPGAVKPLQAQVDLPDFGDSSEADLSSAEEQRLGKIFMQYIRRNLKLVNDPEVDHYVQYIGDQLLNSSNENHQPITVFVIDNPAINAFAGPAGYIGLNTGLILTADSESELAAVIAHELAHVTQRHITRVMQRNKQSSLSTWAGVAAALVIGMYNPQLGGAAIAALIGSNAQASLDFSRENEQEADRVGIRYLTDAGFDANGMFSFFETLHRESQFSKQTLEFLSTHPLTVTRIADIRARIPKATTPHQSSVDFQLIQAKLRVLSSNRPSKSLEWFEEHIYTQSGTDQPSDESVATFYGRALALRKLGRWSDAREQFRQLVAAYPERLPFLVALADLESRTGNSDAALSIYVENINLYFDRKELVQGYVATLLYQREPATALRILTRHRRIYGLNATMYRQLAEVYSQLGKTAESHLAIAEYYYQNGRPQAAIEQVERAQTIEPVSDYLSSRLEARLKELQAEQKNLPYSKPEAADDETEATGDEEEPTSDDG